MTVEKGHFFFHSSFDRYLILDIFLSSIFDTHKAQTKLNFLIHNHALGIGSSVHNVDFCDHTHGPDTLGIDPTGHSKTFLCGHIGISCNYAENDRS